MRFVVRISSVKNRMKEKKYDDNVGLAEDNSDVNATGSLSFSPFELASLLNFH